MDELWKVDSDHVDLLDVLGGPIGAFDDALYLFVANEVDLIRQRIGRGRPLLGICLDAQLMACALGEAAAPMRGKEIGYKPLNLTHQGAASPIACIAGQPVRTGMATTSAGADACADGPCGTPRGGSFALGAGTP